MAMIKKIIKIGDSKAVTIPKSWLAYHERQNKYPIKEVAVEVNDALVIKPIITIRRNKRA